MSSADDSPSARDRWRIQGRAEREAPGAPSPAEALLVELDRIQVRLDDVIEQGRLPRYITWRTQVNIVTKVGACVVIS